MKLLQMFRDMFGQLPDIPDVHEFMHSKRKEYDNDHKFFHLIIQFLGGRSYNCFLDYSLFAIKLNYIHDKCIPNSYNTWEKMKEGIDYLLADDRHDLWQNLPYVLDDVIKEDEHQPISEVGIEKFWAAVVTAIIECINVEGTGDRSISIKYPLTR